MDTSKRELCSPESDAAEDEYEQGWDTQYCQRLQDELLSSSPRTSQTASIHENDDNKHSDDDSDSATTDYGYEVITDDAAADVTVCRQVGELDLGASEAKSPTHQQSHLAIDNSITLDNIENNNGPRPIIDSVGSKLIPDRDNNVKRGRADASGDTVLPGQFNAVRAKMDGYTQLSSLSPTQENPASVYAQYAFQTSTNASAPADADEAGKGASEHTQLDDLARRDPLQAKHHSTVTDSTVHTYGENDTGHVNFDGFTIGEDPREENSPESEESMSQDASFAPRAEEPSRQHQYEPQTPAPPVNPFSQKGSVMRSHEMFKATQPSSIGRHVLSATSSRPSPDVYNDFNTSPAKWMPPSSPLVRRFEPIESSPLQSSVRSLLISKQLGSLNHATTFQITATKSVGAGPESSPQSSAHQPLKYVSMKESQERRQKETSSSSAASDTESDSDIDDISTKRRRERRQREQEIQRQLSTIELHKTMPASSRPVSPSPGEVEVPSTSNGRRRSLQEEYIAQCDGSDARDTQNDDVVADSQTVLDNLVSSGQERVPASSKLSTIQQNGISHTGESNRQPSSLPGRSHNIDSGPSPDGDHHSNAQPTVNASNEPSSPFGQPSLPLKEVSTNRNDLRTPSINKPHIFSDGVDTTVPETSPAEGRILPMGDIATISFGENNADELEGLPGFTQDTEFENAIMPQSSPEPAPRRSKNKRADSHPNFVPSVPDTTSHIVPIALTNAPPQQQSEIISADRRHESTTSNQSHVNPLEPPAVSKAVIFEQPQTLATEEADATAKHSRTEPNHDNLIPEPIAVPVRKEGLRSKEELKGPSRSLRRSGPDAYDAPLVTPKQPPQAAKLTPATKTNSTRSSKGPIPSSPAVTSSLSSVSTPRSVVTRSLARKAREETPVVSQRKVAKGKPRKNQVLSPPRLERPSKRKLATADENSLPQRDSKRRSVNADRESSIDPLLLPHPPPSNSIQRKHANKLFTNMAFAVSYVNQQDEKDIVSAAIAEKGGWILEDGFDILFEPGPASKSRPRSGIMEDLTISAAARPTGFVALIADDHSRRVKYMQALALGLPCISGRWILECISKDEIVDWAAYLLCAGRSSFLGNAIRSRTLQPYPATETTFSENFAVRNQFLEGKSILAVTGKGSIAEKRQHYLFLMRVLGPSRLEQVADLKQARKVLLESQYSWDLVYVGDNEKHATEALFSQAPSASAASKKRKKGPTPSATEPAPEKVRIISDEVVIQSLILGQLL